MGWGAVTWGALGRARQSQYARMSHATCLSCLQKDFEAFGAALDRWNEKANAGNVQAYVSSWGEANPGGGQDNIRRYLEKSRLEARSPLPSQRTRRL